MEEELYPVYQARKFLHELSPHLSMQNNFLNYWKKNIDNYEKQHGEIKLAGLPEDKNIGFKM